MRTPVLLACCGLGTAAGVPAQAPPDTARPRLLDPVVVTAERAPHRLRGLTTAVTRIDRTQLARFPRATLADLLRQAPGFAVIDFDGLGFDPQIMVRGFYGGGEAEYVVVLVDGVPVNRLESGTVAWDVLPPVAAVEAVEVVRGGASSLYGDAAIGGVINVITGEQGERGEPGVRRGELAAGSYGTIRAHGSLSSPSGFMVGGAVDRTEGWRDHAGRTAARLHASVPLIDRAREVVRIGGSAAWRDGRDPGPLLDSLLDLDRRSSDSLFRLDRITERTGALRADASLTRWGGRVNGWLQGDLRSSDAIRTVALAPGYGDTKERLATTRRAWALVQYERPLPARGRLVVGVEGGIGSLDSRYYGSFGGTRSEYTGGTGTLPRGPLDTRGSSRRLSAAAFALTSVEAGPARASLGFRWDGLRDRFAPALPPELATRRSHRGLSPRAGINVRYAGADGTVSTGHLYAAVSRSFKAPTLDQLFDQRNIPVPDPPYQITTSNPLLEPQQGTNVEAGLRHDVGGEPLRAALSLNAYQTAMTDEIDFSLESFRYVNIGKSRHRGVEAEAALQGSWGAFSTAYSLHDARAQSGDHAGKRLKAIPRHTLTTGFSVGLPGLEPLNLATLVIGSWGAYLDDANTRPLPGYARVDLRVSLRARDLILFGDVRNLTGARYSTTAFLDPSGSGRGYFHPAAGRVVEFGVRSGNPD
ncbi:MAG: TonB-dependent receptor [Gemmatimonadales bacterium]